MLLTNSDNDDDDDDDSYHMDNFSVINIIEIMMLQRIILVLWARFRHLPHLLWAGLYWLLQMD